MRTSTLEIAGRARLGVDARPARPATRIAKAGLILALIAGAALAQGCGERVFTATVSGYVRQKGGNAGVNGAEIRVYLDDPRTASPKPAALVRTSSMTSGGNDGYWSHKIIWTSARPVFADEGDSGTVWVEAIRPGYFPRIVEVSGILSDATNVVPTIELTPIESSEVRGRVVNEFGAGVNGVRVVLDLPTTPEVEDDYAATSATMDGVVGVFVFETVAWDDPDSVPATRAITGPASAYVDAKLFVDDDQYYSPLNRRSRAAELAAVRVESGKKNEVAAAIVVRSARFVLPKLKGRVFDVDGSTGVNGVTVRVTLPTSGTTATVTTATSGGEPGWYQFEDLAWTNPNPTPDPAVAFSDKTDALIYIDDANRYSDRDAANPLPVSITSGVPFTVPAGPLDPLLKAGDARFSAPRLRGKVVFAGGSTGVNGVDVVLEIAGSETRLTATTTNFSTGSPNGDGVFEFTNIRWVDTTPDKNSGGNADGVDTQEIRVWVQDDDYSSTSDAGRPVILTLTDNASGTVGTDLLPVKLRNFSAPSLSGYVKSGSAGLAGIPVLLHRVADQGAANDRRATTDKDGKFVFDTVRWTDEEADTAQADAEEFEISLDTEEFEADAVIPVFELESGVAKALADVAATRVERWSYQSNLRVKCVTKATATEPSVGVEGVLVTVDAKPDSGAGAIDKRGGDLRTNATGLQGYTDENGVITFTITWSREAAYSPVTNDATPQPDIASLTNNGDKLSVSITLAESGGYDFADTLTPFDLLSWVQTNSYAPAYVGP